MPMNRREVLLAGPGAAILAGGWAPAGAVSLVIPFPPGGATDAMGRILAPALAAALRQPVLVENLPGGSGQRGAARLAEVPPDGRTLMLGHVGLCAFNPHLFRRLTYDPLGDFAPVGLVGTNPMVVLVSLTSGIANLAQLRARAQEGRLTIGSAGIGSTLHVAGSMLMLALGGAGELITYPGGGAAMDDLELGVLDALVDQAITAIPATSAGARPIAVTGQARLHEIASVPTTAELGLPALDLSVWNMLLAPRGTPPEIVAALARALDAALEDDMLSQRFAAASTIAPRAEERGPVAAAALMAREYERWGRLIRAAGIQGEG